MISTTGAYSIFVDTEFTELSQRAELLSIGCITQSGDIFYGEIEDYDPEKINDFVRENVLTKFFGNGTKFLDSKLKIFIQEHRLTTTVFGPFEKVSEAFQKWVGEIDERLSEYENGKPDIVFVSDVGYYDCVLMIDLLTNHGTSFDLPASVSPAFIDLTNIAMAVDYKSNFDKTPLFGYNTMATYSRAAFDFNREEKMVEAINFLYSFVILDPVLLTMKDLIDSGDDLDSIKHNSLWDAIVCYILTEYYQYVLSIS